MLHHYFACADELRTNLAPGPEHSIACAPQQRSHCKRQSTTLGSSPCPQHPEKPAQRQRTSTANWITNTTKKSEPLGLSVPNQCRCPTNESLTSNQVLLLPLVGHWPVLQLLSTPPRNSFLFLMVNHPTSLFSILPSLTFKLAKHSILIKRKQDLTQFILATDSTLVQSFSAQTCFMRETKSLASWTCDSFSGSTLKPCS